MAPTHALKGLTTREAIADALYRGVQGLDTNDLPLFLSACIPLKDFVFAIDGAEMKGEDFIMEKMFNFIGPMDTTHSISNIRIDVAGDDATEATMTAYGTAQHYRKGDGPDPSTKRLITGGIYDMKLVKDQADGLWKMARWEAKLIWRDGDGDVMAQR